MILMLQKVLALGVQYVAVRPPPGLPLCGLNPAAAFRLPAVSDSGPKGKAELQICHLNRVRKASRIPQGLLAPNESWPLFGFKKLQF